MNPLAWLSPGRWLLYIALAGALVAGYFSWQAHERSIGRDQGRAEIQGKWDKEKFKQQQAVIAESKANAEETQRRLTKQQENQNAQTLELKAARADASRNDADAGRLRAQLADTAKRWRDSLNNPAAVGDRQAAGDALILSAELFGRIDKRAGELAAYADSARIAGLKCERDYQALTK